MKNIVRKIGFYISILTLACCTMLAVGCDSTVTDGPVLPPGVPTNLLASEGTAANLITLTWDVPAESVVTYYRLYRATVTNGSPGTYTMIEDFVYPSLNVEKTEATCDDAALSPGRIYSYQVQAVNESGESDFSGAASGWADQLAPELPSSPDFNSLITTNNQVGKVYIDWDPVPEATSYHIYRSSSPMGTYEEIAVVTDLDAVELQTGVDAELNPIYGYYAYCDDSSLWAGGTVEGQAFYYRVSSENSEGEGPMSEIVNGWFPYPVIEVAPALFSATKGEFENKTVLSWEGVTNASSYVLYRVLKSGDCPTPGAASSYSSFASSSGTTYDDTTGDIDVVYCYTVKARNEAGESNTFATPDFGSRATGAKASPGNPQNIAASTENVNRITVSWTRNDYIATHYLVYRSTQELTGYSHYATVEDPPDGPGNDAISWDDGDGTIGSVTVDTNYYYKVKAVVYVDGNPANAIETESSLTTHAMGFTYPTKPDAPGNVAASKNAYWDRINVTWDATDRVERYYVYRSLDGGSTWLKLADNITTTSYLDTSAEIVALWGIDVIYRIYGRNSNGDSLPEPDNPLETANYGQDIGTVELAQPSISASNSKYNEITVSWNAIDGDNLSGSVSYKVYKQRSGEASFSLRAVVTYDFNSGGNYSYVDSDFSGGINYTWNYYIVPVMGTHEGPDSNVSGDGQCW